VTVRFLRPAEAELDDAIRYYEEKSTGLGARFLSEVVAAVARIVELPDAWQELEAGIRRAQLARFPYGIIYAQEGADIVVLGVFHLHRKPRRWRSWLKETEG
jgi:plasmid stabilization system protein ParE